jgi:hypothetical protein
MSKTQDNLLVSWRERARHALQQSASKPASPFDLSAVSGDTSPLRIKCNGKEAVEEDKPISGVFPGLILGVQGRRLYYPRAFGDGGAQKPVCGSLGGGVPHPDVSNPQNPTCRDCPRNARISANACRGSVLVGFLPINPNDWEGSLRNERLRIVMLGSSATTGFLMWWNAQPAPIGVLMNLQAGYGARRCGLHFEATAQEMPDRWGGLFENRQQQALGYLRELPLFGKPAYEPQQQRRRF